MNSHFRLLLYVLFSVPIALSAALPASASEPQWLEIQSPHFSVITDAGEGRGREVAMRFEQMRAVFGALMVRAKVNSPIPLQIVAFRNSKELRQFVPVWKGKPIQVDGLFIPGEDRSFILLDMSAQNPWAVVFHEYAHQLMNGTLSAQVDPWFEEGFAEYFSSIEVDSKEARVGKIPEYTYQIVQHYGLMKVADLLKVHHQSATYNESGDHRTVFYAESGMLVHYLYDNNLIPNLGSYFSLVKDKNTPVEEALQQSFGMSVIQLDKILSNYVRSGRFKYYPMATPANIVGKEYPMKPLPMADSSAELADIHLHSRDYREQAMAEFQEILKTDPNNAAACRGLGYAYLLNQDYKQAAQYFKRAAQADSKDPRVHYYSALLMSREDDFANESDLPAMIREIETAIALDPTFADSYTLLAFAQAKAGDPAKGFASMQKAISLSPRNEHYQFNLAQMYLNDRKPDQAIPILQGLQRSADQEVAYRAGRLLTQALEYSAQVHNVREPAEARGIPGVCQVTGAAGTENDLNGQSQVSPNNVPAKFLKGTVVSIDCTSLPSATLTIVSATKTWKMEVPDRKHVVVLGADEFSCSWNKQPVAINYRETGVAAGSVISIEIQ